MVPLEHNFLDSCSTIFFFELTCVFKTCATTVFSLACSHDVTEIGVTTIYPASPH